MHLSVKIVFSQLHLTTECVRYGFLLVQLDFTICLIFLEGRRVLFDAFGSEALCPCIESVTKIKEYLTSELPAIDDNSELNTYIRAMRKASNKFLSCFPQDKQDKCRCCKEGTQEYWYFISAIGELRGVFGVMIGQIAKAYGLDVEDELAQIIPE